MALICLCYGVSDRRVRREVANGAASIGEITARCSAGGNCHGCHELLVELLDDSGTALSLPVRFA